MQTKNKYVIAGLITLCAAVPLLLMGQSRPFNLTTQNGSVVIAAGNTYQSILAAKADRQSVTIQNNNASADNCWIIFGTIAGVPVTVGTATKAASILLTPSQAWTRYYPIVPSDQIFGTCTTTSDTIYVDAQ